MNFNIRITSYNVCYTKLLRKSQTKKDEVVSEWYRQSEFDKHSELLYMELKYGTVVIKLLPNVAPNHVARIKELVKEGFYNGLSFHRVIPGFMAQGGDPTGTGAGGTGMKLNAEFSNLHHKRGTVSMARTGDPNSADSQFFICFDNADWLDGQYTIWGESYNFV